MSSDIPLLPTPRARDGDGGQSGTDATGKRGRNLENVALEISQGTQVPPSYEDALDTYLRALDMLEISAKAAIVAELTDFVPMYAQHADDTAKAARIAEDALKAPEGALDILRGDLADLESRMSLVASQADLALLEERIEARIRLSAYEHECGLLREKISKAEQDMIKLTETRNEAHAAAMAAAGGLLVLGDAIARPFETSLGQATDAYKALRAPMTWTILIAAEKDHVEWNQAERQLLELCKVSGFRTEDHAEDLPDEAEHYRKHWRSLVEYQRAPSGAQEVASMHAEGMLAALNKRNREDKGGRIEDNRYPPITIPMARNQAVPPHMQVPDIPPEHRKV